MISLGLLLQGQQYVPDLWSDESVHVYVGPDHSLRDTSYIPEQLVRIPTTSSLIPTGSIQLRLDALMSLIRLSTDMREEIGLPLVVISAYRSHSYQQGLINQFGDGNLRAKSGHSEHQLGLAVDVMGLSNAHMEGDTDESRVYQRLVKHAHHYGRHQSYQNGLATDGYYIEKRHRRYLGPALATELKNHNQTLTQYFYQMIRPVSQSGAVTDNPPHTFNSRATKRPSPTPQSNNAPPPPAPDPIPELYLRPL